MEDTTTTAAMVIAYRSVGQKVHTNLRCANRSGRNRAYGSPIIITAEQAAEQACKRCTGEFEAATVATVTAAAEAIAKINPGLRTPDGAAYAARALAFNLDRLNG